MHFRLNRRNHRHQAGFTLLELLVVVAIIAILASVILANLQSARQRANDAKIQSELQAISKAVEVYVAGGAQAQATDMTQGATASLSTIDAADAWITTLKTKQLLREVPKHPSSPTAEYQYAACLAGGSTLEYMLSGQLTFDAAQYYVVTNGVGEVKTVAPTGLTSC